MLECMNCDKEIDADAEFCYCETCVRRLQAIAAKARAWQERAKWIVKKRKEGWELIPDMTDFAQDIANAELGGE